MNESATAEGVYEPRVLIYLGASGFMRVFFFFICPTKSFTNSHVGRATPGYCIVHKVFAAYGKRRVDGFFIFILSVIFRENIYPGVSGHFGLS